ncbi:MAG: cytochrome-c oxidase [Desulfobacteraceae bacterium]|nr:MAG: cytochrome-c oxidase [Desulfobacteraceae bacterium]
MGISLVKISVIYLLIGTALAMYMAISGDYGLSTVHTHLLLMGWTTMTLAGLIYHLFPAAARSGLCKITFILFNIGVPVMLIGLVLYQSGLGFVAVIAVGATITSLAILLFSINVLTGLRKDS